MADIRTGLVKMQKKIYILPAVTLAASLVSLIFRVFQLIVAVDYGEMGFFDPDAGFIAAGGLYILLIITAGLLIAGAILDKKKESGAFTRTADTLGSKQTAILGFAFLAGACLRLYELVFKFSGFGLSFVGEALIFVLFTAIGFMILSSRRLKPSVGYLHMVICVSYTLKAASLFMQDTIIVRVSDELLLLLSYVGSVLFFLALGRFIAGNESKLTRYKLFIFGGITAALSLCASLAGYVALIIDPVYIGQHMTMHPLSETGTAAVAIASVLIIYGKNTASEGNENGNY